MQKLTENAVTRFACPPGERDAYLWDGSLPGFGVRAYPTGKKSFIVKYQLPNGRQRKMSLAPVQSGMLGEARREAASILLQARKGEDFVGDRHAERERARKKQEEKTTGQIIREYLSLKRNRVRPGTYREIERHLLTIFEPLHNRPIESIGRRDIVAIIDERVKQGKAVQADRAKTSMVGFCNWAIEYDYIQANPAAGISRRTPKEQLERDRVLSMDELAEVWRATEGHSDYEKIIRLLILTAARADEIAQMEWSEVDLPKREINIPKSRMKNAVAHTIYLSQPAVEILENIERRKGKRYVFGRTSNFFSGWSKSKARLDAKLGERVRPWRHHDLRRTLRTNASNLGLAPPVVLEAVLGHWGIAKPGIVGVYDHSTHDAERRKLMDDWAQAVLGNAGK